MPEATSPAKRRLLSVLGAGGGVLGVSALVPATWIKPVVDAVILPTHAQPSPGPGDGGGDPAPEVRGAPTSVTAVVLSDESGLSVTWDAAPTGVDSYTVRYRRSSDSGSEFRADVATVAADAPSLTHTFTFPQGEAALQAGDTFTVEVRAVYGQSGTQAASTHEATDATPAFGQEQRGAPTNVSATLSGTSGVSVAWSAAPVGVDRYTLRYRKNTEQYRTGSGDTATIQADAARTHTFTLPGNEPDLRPGDTFTVEVTAVYDASGTQAATEHAAMDVTPAFGQEQRGAPTNVSATLSGTSGVSVTWGAAPTGVDRYTLRYQKGSDGYRTGVGNTATVQAGATLEHIFTFPSGEAARLPGDTFTVEVTAVYDQSGTQTASTHPATDATPAIADEQRGAPTSVTATLSSDTKRLSVTWGAAPAGVDEYTLRYQRGTAGYRTGDTNTATVAAGATLEHTFTLPGNEADLQAGDTFTVEVTAVYDASGTQARSEHAATGATPAFVPEEIDEPDPGAPTKVTATYPSESSGINGIDIAWDVPTAPGGSTLEGYYFRWSRDRKDLDTPPSGGDGSSVRTGRISSPYVQVIIGQQADDRYYVLVRALYDDEDGSDTVVGSANTILVNTGEEEETDEQRGAPPSVTATLSGTSGVSVTWGAAPTGVDRYTLRYRRGTAAYRTASGTTATVAVNAARTHTFTFPGNEAALQAGDTFTVEVRAVYDANGTQTASTHAATDATPAFVPEETNQPGPGAPTNVVTNYPDTTSQFPNNVVNISWAAPSNPPSAVQGYYVRWSTDRSSFDTTSTSGRRRVNASGRLWNPGITPLITGQQYFGLVRALYTGDGNGDDTVASSPNTVIDASPVFGSEQRGAPTSVTAILSGTSGVSVTWGAAPAGVDRYTLRYRRSSDPGSGYRTASGTTATVQASAARSHTFTFPSGEAARLPGDTFTVEVTAVYDQNGTQAASTHPATDATPAVANEQRDAPTNVTATLSGTSGVNVTWSAAPVGVDRYTLRYQKGSEGYRTGSSNIATVQAGATLEHTFDFPGTELALQAGDTFTVEVTAVYDQIGTQAASTHPVTDATPAFVDPSVGAFTNVVATYPDSTGGTPERLFRVTWNPPSNPPSALQGFQIRWETDRARLDTPSALAARNRLSNEPDLRSQRIGVPRLQSGQRFHILLRALYGSEDGSDTVPGSPSTVLVTTAVFQG